MNYNKKTVKDIDVAGKKVLLRCDFTNAPGQGHRRHHRRQSASWPPCPPSSTCWSRMRR